MKRTYFEVIKKKKSAEISCQHEFNNSFFMQKWVKFNSSLFIKQKKKIKCHTPTPASDKLKVNNESKACDFACISARNMPQSWVEMVILIVVKRDVRITAFSYRYELR